MNDQLALALNIPPPKVHPLPPNWAPFDLAQLPTLSGVCALDFETKDPGIGAGIGSSWAHEGAGFACGVSIAWAGGAFYLPVTHSSGTTSSDTRAAATSSLRRATSASPTRCRTWTGCLRGSWSPTRWTTPF